MKNMKINNSQFVHTHVHSDRSLFDGIASLSKTVLRAREMGFPALAITDHGNMGGSIKLIQESMSTKDKDDNPINFPTIKPLLGMEAYMSRDMNVHDNVGQPEGRKGNYHLILIAKNWKGYQNLCSLSHKAFFDGFYMDPRVDLNLLAKHSEGLICQSACLKGIINQNLLHDRYDQAKKAATLFKDIFGDGFFLEMMFHGIPEERQIIPDIMKLSSELDIPIIASNDVHYIYKGQSLSQEVFMCMQTGTCLNDPKHMKHSYSEFYMKSAEEMMKIFKFCPQALTNTVAVADMVDSKEIEKHLFGTMRLPEFDVPGEFSGPQQFLEKLAWDGMKKLGWDKSQPHIAALQKEIEDIKSAKESNEIDFASYFLMVWDFIDFARRNQIPTGYGRGSGYASVLLRCLGVCYGPDPIEYNLLWERFLGFSSKKFISERDFGFVSTSIDTEMDDDEEDAEGDGYSDDSSETDRY